MVSWRARLAPAALLGLNLAVTVGSVVLSLGREPGFDTVFYSLNAVALGVAGFLIMSHRPGHRMGPLLAAIGLEAALVELAEGYGYHHAWPGSGRAAWASVWASFIGIGATVILPAVFPDGRSLSPRWRPVVWVGVAGVLLAATGAAFGHAADMGYSDGANPYAATGPLPGVLFAAGQLAIVAALVGAIASLAVRYRHSDAEQRRQLRWLLYVLGLLLVVGPLAIFLYDRSVLVQWLIAMTVLLIPIAIGIAVVRHRLYDIDVLISRTLVYGALSAVLAAAWLATAGILGALSGRQHPAWVTAGATVAACAVVLPVRRRLQDLVDRRFRRARYDALATIDGYLEELRTGRATPEDLEPVLRAVLDRPGLRLHYVLPGRSPAGDAGTGDELVSPDVASDVPLGRDGVTRTTIRRAGLDLAVVEHPGPAPDLLADVLARAGLAVEIARLRSEVAHQLAEVNRSRERIVAAGYEERRRLERDLHDGAQQRLVTVGLALRHAQHQLGPSPAGAPVSATLEEAVGQVGAAISELREIARGVRPSGLDNGLAVALRELAGRTPIPVELDLSLDRCPAEIEATAFFVASEAVTNAVKHARAGRVRLRTEHTGAGLLLQISDDGVGGADPAAGSGLRGLGDRVAAHGGALDLASPRAAGTTLTARLPCGS